MIRGVVAAAMIAASLIIVACGDDGDDGIAPESQRTTGTQPTTTPEATAEGLVEVIGIVGALDIAGRTIEITRLSGAEVTRIAIDEEAVFTNAEGTRIQIIHIRPSDRIIARGTVDAAAGVMRASRIEVSRAIDGTQGG